METYTHQIHYISDVDSQMSQMLSHNEVATMSRQTKCRLVFRSENSTGLLR